MKNKIIALAVMVAFVFSILPAKYIFAANTSKFPFKVGEIIVDCEGQRTISDKDRPVVKRDENDRLTRLKLYEQSTYQDKLPNHYYYRTVGYIMALLKAPNVKDDSIITSSYYDNNALRLEENDRMRELIRTTPGYDFGEPYVTSYTFSRQFFDNLFGKDVVDKADWLLRIGLVEFYKTDSEGNEGPALGSMYAVHEDIFKDVTLAMQDMIAYGLVVDGAFYPYIDDFVTRTKYVNLKTGEEIPVFKFKQVDIVEDEEGNTVDVNIRDAELKDNKIVIKPYEGATLKEWVLVKNPPEPLTENITWKDVLNLTGKIQAGGPNETPEITYLASHTVFVRYTLGDNAGGQQGDQSGTEQDIKGDLVLSEKRITKVFDLSKFGLPTFTFSYGSAGKHKHVDEKGDVYYVERSRPVDDKYKYVIGISEELNKLAVATSGDKFSPRFNGTNIKEGIANWNGGSDSVQPNLYFMVWRAKDMPTLASYKEPANHPLLALGLKRGHIPQTTRNTQGGYTENLLIKLGQSAGGDYSTAFACIKCGDTRTQTHFTQDKAEYEITVSVKSFIGGQNIGDKSSDYRTDTFNIGGITFKNVNGFAVSHDNMIKFYPYVQMAYDMFDNGDGASYKTYAINVLAQHLSAIKVNDYVEVGWYNPNPSMSLTINSNQWSTYVRAVEAYGKNSVLPGGALYSLTTSNSPTKVGIRTWQVYVPDNLRQYLVEGQEFSYDRASKADNDFAAQVKNTLDTLDVVQYVSDNPKADNAFGGVEILAKGGQNVYGNVTSSYDKYWLRRGTSQNSNYANEADLDVLDEDKTVTFYRVRADINGNIYVEKSTNGGSSWTTLDSLSKTEGVGNLKNAEAIGLDARTKIITNFVLALDRNKGNDTTVSNGPGWYNEAWDGIYVMRVDRVYTVGFGSPKVRSAALDVKLTPPLDSAGGIFTRYYLSQFKVNEKSYLRVDKPNGYLGNFNGKDVILPNMDLMYVSRKFWIPNCTVMDLKQ